MQGSTLSRQPLRRRCGQWGSIRPSAGSAHLKGLEGSLWGGLGRGRTGKGLCSLRGTEPPVRAAPGGGRWAPLTFLLQNSPTAVTCFWVMFAPAQPLGEGVADEASLPLLASPNPPAGERGSGRPRQARGLPGLAGSRGIARVEEPLQRWQELCQQPGGTSLAGRVPWPTYGGHIRSLSWAGGCSAAHPAPAGGPGCRVGWGLSFSLLMAPVLQRGCCCCRRALGVEPACQDPQASSLPKGEGGPHFSSMGGCYRAGSSCSPGTPPGHPTREHHPYFSSLS